jgi:hypothetical protein
MKDEMGAFDKAPYETFIHYIRLVDPQLGVESMMRQIASGAGGQVVNYYDFVVRVEQAVNQVTPDEAGPAGDYHSRVFNAHATLPNPLISFLVKGFDLSCDILNLFLG